LFNTSSRSPDRGSSSSVRGGVIADAFKHCGVDTECMIIILLPASRRADLVLRVADVLFYKLS